MRKFEEYKVVRINIGHLTQAMSELLADISVNSESILQQESGLLIKLSIDPNVDLDVNIKNNLQAGFDEVLIKAIKLAINNDFAAIEFGNDAAMIEDLPFFME